MYIAKAVIDSITNDYEIITAIPCLPIFDCLENKVDSTIFGKIVFSNNGSIDTTNTFSLVIRPANFPLHIDPCEDMCPTRVITWIITDSSVIDEMMNVLISLDTGRTFTQIGIVPIAAKRYIWNVPTSVTTPVILRFCGGDHCFQCDTMI
jgi:NAD-dependent dihydropyrimidine dehydrogenase PreA subunit